MMKLQFILNIILLFKTKLMFLLAGIFNIILLMSFCPLYILNVKNWHNCQTYSIEGEGATEEAPNVYCPYAKDIQSHFRNNDKTCFKIHKFSFSTLESTLTGLNLVKLSNPELLFYIECIKSCYSEDSVILINNRGCRELKCTENLCYDVKVIASSGTFIGNNIELLAWYLWYSDNADQNAWPSIIRFASDSKISITDRDNYISLFQKIASCKNPQITEFDYFINVVKQFPLLDWPYMLNIFELNIDYGLQDFLNTYEDFIDLKNPVSPTYPDTIQNNINIKSSKTQHGLFPNNQKKDSIKSND